MVDFEKMQANASDPDTVQSSHPVDHRRQLIGGGVPLVQGDDEARWLVLTAQAFDYALDRSGGFAGLFEGMAPSGIVKFPGAVDGDADRNLAAAKEIDVAIFNEHSVGLNGAAAGSLQSPVEDIFQI